MNKLMTPERKFELSAIAAFIDGMIEENENKVYIVVVADDTGVVNVCSNITDNEVIHTLLVATAARAHLGVIEDTLDPEGQT